MLFKVTVRHGTFRIGELVEIPDPENYPEIAKGYLVPVEGTPSNLAEPWPTDPADGDDPYGASDEQALRAALDGEE